MNANTSDLAKSPARRIGRPALDEPSPVDIHVGQRMRMRRTVMGMTQERLGVALGITFQQIQKYERGMNRVSASRLYDLARVLEVPIQYFFDGLEIGKPDSAGLAEGQAGYSAGGQESVKRETLEHVRVFTRIRDPHVRRKLHELARALAKSDQLAEAASDT